MVKEPDSWIEFVHAWVATSLREATSQVDNSRIICINYFSFSDLLSFRLGLSSDYIHSQESHKHCLSIIIVLSIPIPNAIVATIACMHACIPSPIKTFTDVSFPYYIYYWINLESMITYFAHHISLTSSIKSEWSFFIYRSQLRKIFTFYYNIG